MHTLRLLWAARNESSLLRRRKRYNLREKLEKVEEIPESLFVQHFRLNKTTFKYLCQELRTLKLIKGSQEISTEVKKATLSGSDIGYILSRYSHGNGNYAGETATRQLVLNEQVLAALSFLATGSHQKLIGVGLHLTQRTTSRCIREFVDALSHELMVSKWIVFPQTPEERSQIKEKYERNHNIPGVIGCIGCTHISVVKPDKQDNLYLNRKGYHSINVQMICDIDLRILNVNAKFGGATHDSQIWSTSKVEQYMRGLHDNGELVWLLGDSGYPQTPWLMTPISNAEPGSQEELYITRHAQASTSIKHCIGLLKARWKCLLGERVLHYHPSVASKIIKACCVLHNIAIDAQIPLPNEMPIDHNQEHNSDMPALNTDNDLIRGRNMLSFLINSLT